MTATLTFSPELEEKYNVVWDTTNGCFSILKGLCRLTPELVEDIKDYYNIPYEELFDFIGRAAALAAGEGEIDIRVESVSTFFNGKEAVWRISTEIDRAGGGKVKLTEAYFSTGPIKVATL